MTLMSVKALNDYLGAIVVAGTIAIVATTVWSREMNARLDERVTSLENLMAQQVEINQSLNELSKTVAVLADRGERL